MKILFASDRLQRECESRKKLQQTHGENCAKRVAVRLKDLEAAPCLDEFRHLSGNCHELEGDRKGELALDLPDGKRLLFEPADEPTPRKDDGGLDWNGVKSVRIVAIENYHKS